MKTSRQVLRVLAALLPLSLLVLIWLYAAQRALLYYPNPHMGSPALYGLEMRELSLRAEDGVNLRAWYAPARGERRPVVLFFGGNGGHIGYHFVLFQSLLDAGFGLFALNYRGFGGSGGSPDEEGLYRDGRAALEWLARAGVRNEALLLYGQSLGAGVATRMAMLLPARALVLESPFTSVSDRAAEIFHFPPLRHLVRDRFDNSSRVPLLDEPLLILHGEEDGVVPIRHGRELYRLAPAPKVFEAFPGRGHNELEAEKIVAAIEAFLDAARATLP